MAIGDYIERIYQLPGIAPRILTIKIIDILARAFDKKYAARLGGFCATLGVFSFGRLSGVEESNGNPGRRAWSNDIMIKPQSLFAAVI